jgi:hypothetical protein
VPVQRSGFSEHSTAFQKPSMTEVVILRWKLVLVDGVLGRGAVPFSRCEHVNRTNMANRANLDYTGWTALCTCIASCRRCLGVYSNCKSTCQWLCIRWHPSRYCSSHTSLILALCSIDHMQLQLHSTKQILSVPSLSETPPAESQTEEAGVRPTSRQNRYMRLLSLAVKPLWV